MKKKYDLIIAKPPYGKIGAEITKKLIDNVDYDLFLNILPANDYKRIDCLWQYINDMTPINCGEAFTDAAVTTHIGNISKNKINSMNLKEFEISNYIDPQLDKYFKENISRNHYAIDNVTSGCINVTTLTETGTEVLLGNREVPHGHLPYDRNVPSYLWNHNQIDKAKLIELAGCYSAKQVRLMYALLKFDTITEKSNFVTFIYSELGFRFISKIFKASNLDGSQYQNLLPKVSWSRSWSVEELLTDFGYAEKEIKEIIDDLNSVNSGGTPKYKYLNDN